MTPRERARDMWEYPGSTMTLAEIAAALDIPAGTVRAWKCRDGWSGAGRRENQKRKRGGQPGNRNAAGAGAQPWNVRAVKTGAYSAHPLTISKEYTGDGFIIRRTARADAPALSIPRSPGAFGTRGAQDLKQTKKPARAAGRSAHKGKERNTQSGCAAPVYCIPNAAAIEEMIAGAEPLDTGAGLEEMHIPPLDDFIFPVLAECPAAHITAPDVSADDTPKAKKQQHKR